MLTCEEFVKASRAFVQMSDKLRDGWKLCEEHNIHRVHIKKDAFIQLDNLNNCPTLCKAEYIIFFNISYGVPAFSFNIWASNGSLLPINEIRKMSFVKMEDKEFYSVITQQEHPLFFRPYFVMHPCQTETLLTMLKDKTKNIIVTFLSLITPLIKLDLPMEYGL